MTTAQPTPNTVTLKARDLKPYHYGVWCSVRDPETGNESKPFCNTIVYIRWNGDGKYLWLGLETHNTIKVAPDEDVEVIPERGTHAQTRDRYAQWVLPPPRRTQRYDHPYTWSASGPECGVCGRIHEPNLEP